MDCRQEKSRDKLMAYVSKRFKLTSNSDQQHDQLMGEAQTFRRKLGITRLRQPNTHMSK